jgi:hypothetical protein
MIIKNHKKMENLKTVEEIFTEINYSVLVIKCVMDMIVLLLELLLDLYLYIIVLLIDKLDDENLLKLKMYEKEIVYMDEMIDTLIKTLNKASDNVLYKTFYISYLLSDICICHLIIYLMNEYDDPHTILYFTAIAINKSFDMNYMITDMVLFMNAIAFVDIRFI